MIDLEFSKYYDDHDTTYAPYRCTCAPGQKCQACHDNPTVLTWASKDIRGTTRDARRSSSRTALRQQSLRTFAARWVADTGQLPLPGEILAARHAHPPPAWVPAMTLLYCAYASYTEWHADCVAQGIGTAQLAQEATARLHRQRDVARRKPKRRRLRYQEM